MASLSSAILRISLLAILSISYVCVESYSLCSYPSSVCGSVRLDGNDKNVLLKLKSTLKGNGDFDDWDPSLTCDSGWNGICTNKNGRVTEIDLSGFFSPYGSIPDSLGQLQELIYLDFGTSSFSSLPSTIGSLSNLQFLSLYSPIRVLPSSFPSLSKLKYLEIGGSRLDQSILPMINKLTSLTYLNLFDNWFSFIPPSSLQSLTKLSYLDFSLNALLQNTPIPSFSTLKSLQYIDLNSCGLIGTIPNSFASFKNLTYLNLSQNRLCGGIPTFLGSLPQLKHIDVRNNFLSGRIPSNLPQSACKDVQGVFENCLTPPSQSCNLQTKTSAVCLSSCNFVPGFANDIAFNYESVSMSSKYGRNIANLAVDGSAGNGSLSSLSCAHTHRELNPWIKVELQRPANVATVQLYNRLDCCSNRLDGVRVYVGSSAAAFDAQGNVACTDPKFRYKSTNKGFPLNVTCQKRGKYVWVVTPGKERVLTVCEVVVFGSWN